ncbi:hypothetical protein B0G75_10450 [Paraburkholderia sp. BL18I3N2]|uniref:hypothetical protein n=1 Tax=Paraburkholderia sp. BL18I3N2 TaxID=1938799 RepID=UPI000D07FF0D|nr:hypothetical protein [Paraburkholderia sp. BL18I3N2]PRX32035.1 hypothetical protein B0G75_10450 [Paraburkholderia sp. BL18I3N2]
MWLFRESLWSFDTSAAGGFSLDFLVASGGEVLLKDPKQQSHTFHYGRVGVGYGFGARLPRIRSPKVTLPEIRLPKISGHEVGGSVASKNFTSNGYVFMTDAFAGSELRRSDLQGGVVYIDAGAGLFAGEGATLMLLGINAALLTMSIVNPGLSGLADYAIRQAPAALVMYGHTAALQAGFGAGLLVGMLH